MFLTLALDVWMTTGDSQLTLAYLKSALREATSPRQRMTILHCIKMVKRVERVRR